MYSLKLVLFDLVSLGFGAVFLQILFVISKKQKQEWIRFAHKSLCSLRSVWVHNPAFKKFLFVF